MAEGEGKSMWLLCVPFSEADFRSWKKVDRREKSELERPWVASRAARAGAVPCPRAPACAARLQTAGLVISFFFFF